MRLDNNTHKIRAISVMTSGLRVSPVPCRPPVYVSATVMKRPDTLRYRSSCRPC